jgi:hypothetical protein
MYTLWHKSQKSALDNSGPSGPIGHIFIHDCIGLLLPAYWQERQKMPGWAGSDGYNNGRLSGVLDEVLLLLLDDHSGRQ